VEEAGERGCRGVIARAGSVGSVFPGSVSGSIHKLCAQAVWNGRSAVSRETTPMNWAFSTAVSTGRARVLRRVSRETGVPVDNPCG
jgi:hypothetical protein